MDEQLPQNQIWMGASNPHRLAMGFRSAAVHWGEGLKGGYYVIGHHFEWIHPYGEHFLGYTPITHCNLSHFFPY